MCSREGWVGPVASGPPTQLSISGAPSSGEPLSGAAAYVLEKPTLLLWFGGPCFLL